MCADAVPIWPVIFEQFVKSYWIPQNTNTHCILQELLGGKLHTEKEKLKDCNIALTPCWQSRTNYITPYYCDLGVFIRYYHFSLGLAITNVLTFMYFQRSEILNILLKWQVRGWHQVLSTLQSEQYDVNAVLAHMLTSSSARKHKMIVLQVLKLNIIPTYRSNPRLNT